MSSSPYTAMWDATLEKLQRVAAPKYRVMHALGYGGMAGVFLAEELALGRFVAIKVMAPTLMADPALVERFQQEARTIAKLHHPNIITIFDIAKHDDLCYFAMSYIRGRTVGDVMAEAGEPVPIDVVNAWLYQAAVALEHASRAGVVHRDVKPGNLLLDHDGNVVVTDFGIAKVAEEPSLTRTGMLIGTPAYMSPEQCSSGPITAASDQYSLGTVAYQVLTGEPPFTGPTMAVLQAHVGTSPTPITDLRPDCPAHLASVVERMMAKRPDDRWPTLSAALEGLGGPPPLGGPVRDQMRALAALAATVDVAPTPPVVREGAFLSLQATPRDDSGTPIPGRRTAWRSDAPDVAQLADSTLHAVRPGTVRLVTSAGSATHEIALTIEPDPLRALVLDRTELKLEAGQEDRLLARGVSLDGSPTGERAAAWQSDDPSVAEVGVGGVIRGVRPGQATITAQSGGVTTSAVVSIGEPGSGARTRAGTRSRAGVSRSPATAGATAGSSPRRRPRVPAIAAVVALTLAGAGAVALAIALPRGSDETPPVPATVPAGQVEGAPTGGDPLPPTGVATSESTGTGAAAADSAPADLAATAEPRPAGDRRAPGTTPTPGPGEPRVPTAERQAPSRTPPPPAVRVSEPATAQAQTPVTPAPTPEPRSEDAPARVTAPAAAPPEANPTGQAAAPDPQPSEPDPAAARLDAERDAAGIQAALTAYGELFARRDPAAVSLLPASSRTAWSGLFRHPSVSQFQASVATTAPPAIGAETATAPIALHVSFNQLGREQRPVLSFLAHLRRGGAPHVWELTRLEAVPEGPR